MRGRVPCRHGCPSHRHTEASRGKGVASHTGRAARAAWTISTQHHGGHQRCAVTQPALPRTLMSASVPCSWTDSGVRGEACIQCRPRSQPVRARWGCLCGDICSGATQGLWRAQPSTPASPAPAALPLPCDLPARTYQSCSHTCAGTCPGRPALIPSPTPMQGHMGLYAPATRVHTQHTGGAGTTCAHVHAHVCSQTQSTCSTGRNMHTHVFSRPGPVRTQNKEERGHVAKTPRPSQGRAWGNREREENRGGWGREWGALLVEPDGHGGGPGSRAQGSQEGERGHAQQPGAHPRLPYWLLCAGWGGQSQGAAGRVPALQTGLRPSSSHSPTHSLSSRRPLGLAHWRCPLPSWALTVSSSVHWTPEYLSSRAWQPCPLAQSRLLRQGTTRLMPLPLGPGDPSAPPGQPQQR